MQSQLLTLLKCQSCGNDKYPGVITACSCRSAPGRQVLLVQATPSCCRSPDTIAGQQLLLTHAKVDNLFRSLEYCFPASSTPPLTTTYVVQTGCPSTPSLELQYVDMLLVHISRKLVLTSATLPPRLFAIPFLLARMLRLHGEQPFQEAAAREHGGFTDFADGAAWQSLWGETHDSVPCPLVLYRDGTTVYSFVGRNCDVIYVAFGEFCASVRCRS